MNRPKKGALHLTDRAVSDLQEIHAYSMATWGRRTATKYMKDFESVLDRLAANPSLLRLEPSFLEGLYFYRVAKHLIVCDAKDTDVIVLAVLSTSMDIVGRLAELEPRLQAEAALLRSKLYRKS